MARLPPRSSPKWSRAEIATARGRVRGLEPDRRVPDAEHRARRELGVGDAHPLGEGAVRAPGVHDLHRVVAEAKLAVHARDGAVGEPQMIARARPHAHDPGPHPGTRAAVAPFDHHRVHPRQWNALPAPLQNRRDQLVRFVRHAPQRSAKNRGVLKSLPGLNAIETLATTGDESDLRGLSCLSRTLRSSRAERRCGCIPGGRRPSTWSRSRPGDRRAALTPRWSRTTSRRQSSTSRSRRSPSRR